MRLRLCIGTALLLVGTATRAQEAKIIVDAAHPGHAISPTLWGIFFEDINLSADGGIYPELVRNRSFEDADTPKDWTFTNTTGHCDATISTADVHGQPVPLNCFNRKSLRVQADGSFALLNDGYWGMNFVKGDGYTFRFAARGDKFDGKLAVKLLSSTGKVLARGEIAGFGDAWKYHTLDLTVSGSDPKGRLEIDGEGKGTLFLDMVSLMPKKTWKNHGLRTDLAESLNALHPKFLRFPGGCWVEGDDFAHMNHWKDTIGNIDVRTPLWNIWGYNATRGLGFFEYLQLAEDLGAEPLFCINIGMSHKETVPVDRMAQWVQDALDAIEYANGPTNSVWGSMRAAAGHPAPFNLRYLEIGNENGGFPDYVAHWKMFYKAIHARYPSIKFVANGWNDYGDCSADIVDDHYYNTPEWFIRHADQYDKTDRNGPKVFVGEYAVTKNCGLGNLRGAIGEAAFMTGLERNSDVVAMAAYAPLLVNLNHRSWNPDLINFDSSTWYGLPSYYVQQMFAVNQGDTCLPTTVQSPDVVPKVKHGMIGVGTWNTAAEYKDIEVTDSKGNVLFKSDFSNGTKGWKLEGGDWSVHDGALRQTVEKSSIRALAGDESWVDYIITLKARKISGKEGFRVRFHVTDQDEGLCWNVGGWNNAADAIEAGDNVDYKATHIDTGRWYDLKLSVVGNHVQCWLDGKIVHDVDIDMNGKYSSLYATAASEKQTGDIIVKLVNVSAGPLNTKISLPGAALTGKGMATLLTSASSEDENTLDEPTKVSPKTHSLNVKGTTLNYLCPANSLTVIRLKTGE